MSKTIILLITIYSVAIQNVYCPCPHNSYYNVEKQECVDNLDEEKFVFVSPGFNIVQITKDICKSQKLKTHDEVIILHKMNGLNFFKYGIITCLESVLSPEFYTDDYHSEKSCCRYDQHYEASNKTCTLNRDKETSHFKQFFTQMSRYIFSVTNIPFQDRKKDLKLNDYDIDIYNLTGEGDLIHVKTNNKTEFVIDVSKENKNYCLGLRWHNARSILRVSENVDCGNNNNCISKCDKLANNTNSTIVKLFKYNSTENIGLETLLLQTPDIVVQKSFICPGGFKEIYLTDWSINEEGYLVIPRLKFRLHPNEYCLHLETNKTYIYTCKNNAFQIEMRIANRKHELMTINSTSKTAISSAIWGLIATLYIWN